MTDSPLTIPVYDGSLVSIRTPSSGKEPLHESVGIGRR